MFFSGAEVASASYQLNNQREGNTDRRMPIEPIAPYDGVRKANKGTQRMPRYLVPMKDVLYCENLR